MKTTLIAVGALVALSGYAVAVEDESAFTLDLSGAKKDANAYHLKCQYGKDLTTCGTPSVWEDTNGETGLQTKVSMTGTPRDTDLLS